MHGVIQAEVRYSISMARGWESKSVEDQLEQREEAANADKKKTTNAADAGKQRARQLLQLKRERILAERTSSPLRRNALGAALKAIEGELSALG